MTAYALRDGEDTILVARSCAARPRRCWRRWRDRHEVTIFGHEYCATRLDDRSLAAAKRAGTRAGLARPPWSRSSLY